MLDDLRATDVELVERGSADEHAHRAITAHDDVGGQPVIVELNLPLDFDARPVDDRPASAQQQQLNDSGAHVGS